MFLFGNLISALADILDFLLGIYKWIVIISALLSWVNPDPYNPIVRFLYSVTEPVYYKVRYILDKFTGFGGGFGGLDLSPIIVLLLIMFLQSFLVRSLHELAFKLQ
ncbi:YggT family protein [bacterium]|nr:YggT family protein [bacterium]